MSLSWKIGRVAGIDLYLHATFLLMIALLALVSGGLLVVAFVTALFGCVLLHELGHALMARRLGVPTEDITLYPIGGIARLRRMPRNPEAELLIALAGPAVNVVIAAGLGTLYGFLVALAPGAIGSLLVEFLRNLLLINLILAVFNLAPIFPMDGGRVLRALLSRRFGRLKGTEIAATLGQALAVIAGLVCLVLTITGPAFLLLQIVMAAFLYIAAGAELAQVRAEELGRWTARRIPNPPLAYSWTYRGDGVWLWAPVIVREDHPEPWPQRGPAPWI